MRMRPQASGQSRNNRKEPGYQKKAFLGGGVTRDEKPDAKRLAIVSGGSAVELGHNAWETPVFSPNWSMMPLDDFRRFAAT